MNNFHEYLIQHSLKSGGTKDHFRQVKVPGNQLPLTERLAMYYIADSCINKWISIPGSLKDFFFKFSSHCSPTLNFKINIKLIIHAIFCSAVYAKFSFVNTNNLWIPSTIVQILICRVRVRAMVFNATFNNISVILWRTVLLVEETRVPGENHLPVACQWKLNHIMLYRDWDILISGAVMVVILW